MLAASAAFRLLLSPAGRVVLVVIALFLWTAYQRNDATADCKEDQLRRELAAANAALKDAVEISRAADERAATATRELAELERIKDDVLAEIRSSNGSCALSDADRDRLLRIK